MKERLSYSY